MFATCLRRFSLLLLAIGPIVSTPAQLHAAELLMFESDDCIWCKIWDEDIAPIYPKTAEGKRAPLRRVDIHDPRPVDLRHIEGVRFTPTFVLVDDRGEEIGRINGYPGEDFFWGLLSELVRKLPADPRLEPDPLTST